MRIRYLLWVVARASRGQLILSFGKSITKSKGRNTRIAWSPFFVVDNAGNGLATVVQGKGVDPLSSEASRVALSPHPSPLCNPLRM